MLMAFANALILFYGMAKVLYLTYDGMTDPLGQAQIWPYLSRLRDRGHSITIVSFEKQVGEERLAAQRAQLQSAGISWKSFPYHKQPAIFSTLWDLWRMRQVASRILREEKFDIVHARSYLPAIVGFVLRRVYKIKLVFDARGFWIDERIEGKIWNSRNPIFKLVIGYLRQWEQRLFASADHVVLLTERAKELVTAGRPALAKPDRVTVIPCCVDVSLFRPSSSETLRKKWFDRLNIPPARQVILYHGSWGTWYLTREVMRLMRIAKLENENFILLVATPQPAALVLADAQAEGVAAEDVRVVSVGHREIPELLSVARLAVFFIAPVFSKQASSPTKLGEIVACGVPLITNTGVGDNDRLLRQESAAALVGDFSPETLKGAVRKMNSIDLPRFSSELVGFFALGKGVDSYDKIYKELTS